MVYYTFSKSWSLTKDCFCSLIVLVTTLSSSGNASFASTTTESTQSASYLSQMPCSIATPTVSQMPCSIATPTMHERDLTERLESKCSVGTSTPINGSSLIMISAVPLAYTGSFYSINIWSWHCLVYKSVLYSWKYFSSRFAEISKYGTAKLSISPHPHQPCPPYSLLVPSPPD